MVPVVPHANEAYNRNSLLATVVEIPVPIEGNDAYPVTFRRPLTLDTPRARYPGFKQEKLKLKKGTVRRQGALALSCDIIFERDVAVSLRDGTVIYTDVFRPVENGKYPGIIAWSPYGKEVGGYCLDDYNGRGGVPLPATSELIKFEGPDPAYWVNQGYVVLNPDTRGSYASEGNIMYWGKQDSADGYDFIEWAAKQPWSNGKLGMTGNSWLAISQWQIAATQPPHLAAIAPWEGYTDPFRQSTNRGGLPVPGFYEGHIAALAGNNLVEDIPRMSQQVTFYNEYWQDKTARLDKITIPAYVVSSYTNPLHTHGTFEGFRHIKSEHKWLRVHNSFEWPDTYNPSSVAELTSFFDHYLKDRDNDWESTPRVRISILDPSHGDEVNVIQKDWPVPDVKLEKFYIASDSKLSYEAAVSLEQSVSYNATAAEGITFTCKIVDTADIIGYMKLKLWLEADGANDMELDVKVQKLTANGKQLAKVITAGGVLRVSHRALDVPRSSPSEPFLLHQREDLLEPGQIVPVEIGIWPIALRVHAGEMLAMTVSPFVHHSAKGPDGKFVTVPLPAVGDGFSINASGGFARVPVPAEGGTFTPGAGADDQVEFIIMGGPSSSDPPFVAEQYGPHPVSRNAGTHIIHYGGKYDSHLLVPFKKA